MGLSAETKGAGTLVVRGLQTCPGDSGRDGWGRPRPQLRPGSLHLWRLRGVPVARFTQLLGSKAGAEPWVPLTPSPHSFIFIQSSWVHLLIFSSSPALWPVAFWGIVIRITTWTGSTAGFKKLDFMNNPLTRKYLNSRLEQEHFTCYVCADELRLIRETAR